MRTRALAVTAAALAATALARAQPGPPDASPPDAGQPDASVLDAGVADAASTDAAPTADVRPRDAGPIFNTCVERIPEGKRAPKLSQRVPRRGTSGWAAVLRVAVEHGKGETVLPNGFQVQLDTDAYRALEKAGWVLPDPEGGSGPIVETTTKGERSTTKLDIAFVALPEEPGRQTLVLPPLPIAIERASGEVITLCTRPERIVIEDPIANTPDAKPKDNPSPRRQKELWETARDVSIAALIALAVGALAAWLIIWWRRRPKVEPPPPPPRPPWVVALEELDAIRTAGLIETERFEEHFDRVSNAIRRYLGDRYGFDGLESTTREMTLELRRIVPPVAVLEEIERFLGHADLVKFARLTPSEAECTGALELGERIVRATIPPRPDPSAPAPATADGAEQDDEAASPEAAERAVEPPAPAAEPTEEVVDDRVEGSNTPADPSNDEEPPK